MPSIFLSVVIPTYNSIEKMAATIASLDSLSNEVSHEVVFVDDASTDDTFDRLTELGQSRENWHVHQLSKNSGSAAAPRNLGIDIAQGEYLFFLDSDDVLLPNGLLHLCQYAQEQNNDVVRSTILLVHGNGHKSLVDKIPRWEKIQNPSSKLRAIVKFQSLTCSFLMRKSLLEINNIRFPLGRRIGEDITFTAKVISVATALGYQNVAARTYVRNGEGEDSVTQSIDSGQFADFVNSWIDVENILAPLDVSFVKEHGHAAIQYALRQYVWFKSESMDKQTFRLFRDYVSDHWPVIRSMPFAERYIQLIGFVHSGNIREFNRSIRLRMIVAGHDLKFLKNIIPELENHYDVKTDKWDGHNSHNVASSTDLLNWADLVWAEWMLGAAVWYSDRIRSDQRLIIRAHRSEMTVDYGLNLNQRNCSRIIAIAPHCLADFSDRFDIPRYKFKLIPNGFDIDAYSIGEDPDRLYTIGMVGILPKLKGFHRAIELLSRLRALNPKFRLKIYGSRPAELAWLNDIEAEKEYYAECEERISELDLADYIDYEGWVSTEKELANVGFVLSLSDLEGMQVAPGEAFCAGAQGLFLGWRGVEYMYPSQFIFPDLESMGDYIVQNLDPIAHRHNATVGRDFLIRSYSQERINTEIIELLRSIRA